VEVRTVTAHCKEFRAVPHEQDVFSIYHPSIFPPSGTLARGTPFVQSGFSTLFIFPRLTACLSFYLPLAGSADGPSRRRPAH